MNDLEKRIIQNLKSEGLSEIPLEDAFISEDVLRISKKILSGKKGYFAGIVNDNIVISEGNTFFQEGCMLVEFVKESLLSGKPKYLEMHFQSFHLDHKFNLQITNSFEEVNLTYPLNFTPKDRIKCNIYIAKALASMVFFNQYS